MLHMDCPDVTFSHSEHGFVPTNLPAGVLVHAGDYGTSAPRPYDSHPIPDLEICCLHAGDHFSVCLAFGHVHHYSVDFIPVKGIMKSLQTQTTLTVKAKVAAFPGKEI